MQSKTLMRRGEGEGQKPTNQPVQVRPEATITISQAIDKFLDSLETERTKRGFLAQGTKKDFDRILKEPTPSKRHPQARISLEQFMREKGLRHLPQITRMVRKEYEKTFGTSINYKGEFYDTEPSSQRQLQKKVEVFFKFCVSEEYIPSVPKTESIIVPEQEMTIPLVEVRIP